MNVLYMTLNSIWWWGSSLGDLRNVKYPFIAVELGFFLPEVVVLVIAQSMNQMELFYHLTEFLKKTDVKLIVLQSDAW